MTVDGETTNYIYDANNRLLSTTGWGSASYTYDANGNMTRAAFGTGATVTCTYDGFNRLEKVNDNGKETVYTYDADGLRSSSNESWYIWDQGQLVATIANTTTGGMLLSDFTLPEDGCKTVQMPPLSIGTRYYAVINGTACSAVAKYVKGERMRARVTISGEEKPEIPPVTPYDRVILDFGSVAMEMEYSESGSDQMDVYVVGFKNAHVKLYVKLYNGAPIGGSSEAESTVYIRGLSLIYGGSLMDGYNYHYDAHGNVVQLSRGRSTVFKDYYYDAFGVEQNADPADTNPFRYCGEQYDTETGNYYLRARYYTPRAGRFTQEDPIRDGLNWYAYCAGNPIMLADPSGCIGEWIKTGIHWAIHAGERSVNALPGIDTASIGAYCLNMFEDPNQEGVYHASRDCWQAGAGYNSLYDFLFDLGTEMRVTRTVFTSEGVDYAVWAWKGDYINLGAGAELGIYRKSAIPGHWDVDKNLAMPMTLKLTDKEDNLIFRYAPKEPQWWITGFKPSMQNVDPDDLKATFTVDFSQNSKMFEAFKNVGGDGWYFDSKTYKATLVFN